MVAAIVGCGDSAEHWAAKLLLRHPLDDEKNYVIPTMYGVNDAFKWGFRFDNLIVVNGPHKFDGHRLKTIVQTDTRTFFTNLATSWKAVSKRHNIVPIRLSPFLGQISRSRDILMHTKTSPFIAMSMAVNDGHTDIRLFGVDFNDHGTFRYGQKKGNHEIAQYAQFAELAAKEGIRIRVTKDSALAKYIDTF